ncbi:MAG: hypothetical protein M1834_002594 [Cirrosporium novae-zelandiae]|nr:MAG: hypothetical protein M1834_002594 [Cirrosporium novae-zelandiae]
MSSQPIVLEHDTPSQPQSPSSSSSDYATNDSSTPSLSPPEGYTFPTHKLKPYLEDSTKEPLVLVACGSFSPITFLHLRMFEIARDFVRLNANYEIIGGYLSPVSDAYKKSSLVGAHHRIKMCEAAVSSASDAIMTDSWEASQKEYQPTAQVLDHFDHEINEVRGGIETYCGERRHVRIALLAGADLMQTMSTPGVWSDKDLDHILGKYGLFIVERAGTDTDEALASLRQWEDNIYVMPQLVHNDISSTKIRLFLKREMSVRYLIPSEVIDYIEAHGLYQDDGTGSVHEGKGKEEVQTSSGSHSSEV